MKLREFHYNLPKELIAQEPIERRDMSRLMVLDRKNKSIVTKNFCDIAEYIKKGDLVVLNNTKVLPVRLYGKRKTGGQVEIFILNPGEKKLKALIRPSKRIKCGEKIEIGKDIYATIYDRADAGRFVEFNVPEKNVLELGRMPLPPYIDREDKKSDGTSYQTVYAAIPGATASPTAGLHFTWELLDKLKNKGVDIVYVTLHTSYGTFAPVTEERIKDHKMHEEYYEISSETAATVNRVKSSGGKVFAVGTTSVRVLETSKDAHSKVKASTGKTNIFIYPGYKFGIIDGLITNFHLPESTLIMLVSAFAGRDFIMEAYKKAIQEKFRFFSYGDAMLIL
ncbi:MAG: tRNA preQ1(34) S-adenosylmethionine ribosyltransferase-isomerase QueA [Candidatus Omnitrophica bacterium]|nr:tRNA preQ1(34) S-adenosylmethionine ribosyltransferase-isomerase QueA [Candidatus Omnitrophota bacterium]